MPGIDLCIDGDQERSIQVALEPDLMIAIRTSWTSAEGKREGNWVYLTADQVESVARSLLSCAIEARFIKSHS